ncbi:uncharacterized protein METZ01_LOCUS386468 [marine metagenome]|uniref:Uncharacterized protein n=1 Tax=marine metagenome TaxID=408172 RepID=A0A382UH53_9ZZZZ
MISDLPTTLTSAPQWAQTFALSPIGNGSPHSWHT